MMMLLLSVKRVLLILSIVFEIILTFWTVIWCCIFPSYQSKEVLALYLGLSFLVLILIGWGIYRWRLSLFREYCLKNNERV